MYKNNIITISGVPVSGKGTTIKKIIEKLEKQGYKPENIHHVSTGHIFRDYFNAVEEIIRNTGNLEKANIDFKGNKDMEKLFHDTNFRSAIIRAVIALRKRNYNLEELSIEQANNLEELKDVRAIIDNAIDSNIKNLGIEINKEEHPNDIWLIDSRLAFDNIPESFSVRLTVDENKAAERLYNDHSRGKEDNKYKNVQEAKKAILKRKSGEIKRYLERYNVNLEDEDNYDLIIDTSYSTVDDIADVILSCNERYRKNQDFGKKWASPKIFLPLQSELSTLQRGRELNMDEMMKSIKENGYYPDKSIQTINVDGRYYIIEGHHRNFGAAIEKKTLIPYDVITKDEGIKERAKGLTKSYLTGHEWLIGKDFSYKEVYPEIYEELERKEKELEQR